jgi:hypothetical protein
VLSRPPNKRMQLAIASTLANVGLCAVKKSPQLMRGPLDRRHEWWDGQDGSDRMDHRAFDAIS